MKKCPFCAEEIQDEALVCRFCGRDLSTGTPGTSSLPAPAAPPPPQYVHTVVQAAPAPRTNGMAIAALVLGIVWIYGVGSILALVFGYSAKKEIDRSNGQQTGRGLAIAGIILGWVGVAGLTLIIIAIVAASSHSSPQYP